MDTDKSVLWRKWKEKLPAILVVMSSAAIGAFSAWLLGMVGEVIFAVALVSVSVALSFFCWMQKRKLRRVLETMTMDEVETYVTECRKYGIQEPFDDLEEKGLSLLGQSIDVFLGCLAFVGPPLLYHILSGVPLSWNAAFTGWHLLCALGGCLLYGTTRSRILYPFMTTTPLKFRNMAGTK